MPRNITAPKVTEVIKEYNPEKEELDIQKYLLKRVPVLKDSKKNILDNLNYELLMQEADKEYQPRFLREKGRKNFMFVQDELTGLRGSRAVPISAKDGEEWRSDVSSPQLFVKIQTALSILVDQNPEAVFKASSDRFKKTTNFAYSLWKRSWNVARSKHQLKLFIFDLAKYGWAVGRTYPRIVRRTGEVLKELDTNNPENNKYEERDIIEFNDIYREKLDPYRTWIDDMANLTDPWSLDDWYFEKDYSKDTFDREFGQYSNAKFVKAGQPLEDATSTKKKKEANDETLKRTDIITVGFYESKNKDLYAIFIPKQDIVLYFSPLPNDDKKLSIWWAYWNERDPRTPYGIGLYEIIKHNKVLYDRLKNMSVDQLVMAIYPMLFYSGGTQMAGTGDLIVSPGLIKQKLPGTTIEQVNVKYDGRGFEGAAVIANEMDDDTGITPTLQGEIAGKTLGETLHAKEAALKRLNIPLENIAQALEEEAYISLSWMQQVYSTPEVMEFETADEMQSYLSETGKQPVETNAVLDEATGQVKKYVADFLPVLELGLSADPAGNLTESPEDRFFRLGLDIKTTDIKWEGRINVQPQSIISPSLELEKQRKTELYNLILPTVQLMSQALAAGQTDVALALYKPTSQILEINDEKPEDWLPDDIITYVNHPEILQQQKDAQAQAQQEAANPLFTDPNAPPADQKGATPGATPNAGDTIVPRKDVTNPARESVQSTGNYNPSAGAIK